MSETLGKHFRCVTDTLLHIWKYVIRYILNWTHLYKMCIGLTTIWYDVNVIRSTDLEQLVFESIRLNCMLIYIICLALRENLVAIEML